MVATLLLALLGQADKPAWARSPEPATFRLLSPHGVACRAEFAVVWRDWDDASVEKNGKLGDGPLNWWNTQGRREFPSLCPVEDPAKADFVYLWSNRRFKEECVELEDSIVQGAFGDTIVKVPVRKQCDRQTFYIELKCAATGDSLRSATQRDDEPAVFTFDDAVRMMADPKTTCPAR
jgi:hypothetical protein